MKRNILNTLSFIAIVTLQLIFNNESFAQLNVSNRTFGFNVGFTKHQTQSINGCILGLNHEIPLKKKLRLHNDFSIMVNSGKDPVHDATLMNVQLLAQLDPAFKRSPIYFLTAGIQTTSAISTSFFSDKLRIGAGSLFRYQTTNKPEDYTFNIIRSGSNTITYYTKYVINSIRPHKLSIGGVFFADLDLFKIKLYDIKANMNYQFDSGNDRIFSFGIKVQKDYKKS